MIYVSFRYLFVILSVVCTFFSARGAVFQIKSDEISNIGRSVAIYRFETDKIHPDNLDFNAENWVLNRYSLANIGVSEEYRWAQFSLKNSYGEFNPVLFIDYASLDYITLFNKKNGVWEEVMTTGEAYAFKHKKYQLPTYVIPLQLPFGESGDYLIRVKNLEVINLPVYVGSEQNVIRRAQLDILFNAGFGGIIIIMVLFNTALYYSFRQRIYFAYVSYLVFMGLTQIGLKGVTYQFLWPDSPEWQHLSIIIFSNFGLIFAMWYFNQFISFDKNLPKLSSLVYLLNTGALGSLILLFTKYQTASFFMMFYTTLLFILFYCFALVKLLRKQIKEAKIFTYGWAFVVLGSLIFMLKDIGILPVNHFTNYAVQLFSCIEIVIFTVAIAQRSLKYSKEKELMQAKTIEVLRENETVIKDHNIKLEKEVALRTESLHETNHKLSVAYNNLKLAQSKMSTLGRVTASIAHDIRTPLSIVGMSFDPLYNILHKVEEVIVTHEDPAYKQRYQKLLDDTLSLVSGIDQSTSKVIDIVDLVRMYTQKEYDEHAHFDVAEQIKIAIGLVRHQLGATKVVNDIKEGVHIYGVPTRMIQLFLNLLLNANEAMEEQLDDNESKVIKLFHEINENCLVIHVEDRGPALDKSEWTCIFDPFYTTKNTGCGLGLSEAKDIVKEFNGDIAYKPTKEGNSMFLIQLPLTENKH